MVQSAANSSQIVSAAPVVARTGVGMTGTTPIIRLQLWAPAWFCSALNWLRKSYFDANNAAQALSTHLIGSDVDPYMQLGSTRLSEAVGARLPRKRRRTEWAACGRRGLLAWWPDSLAPEGSFEILSARG